DCDSGCRGFEPHQPPHYFSVVAICCERNERLEYGRQLISKADFAQFMRGDKPARAGFLF
ncbi:hypothetical protein Q7I15_21030, partial [Aeromonas veronii]|uniref:hypothetical protein n=1 Tax=Aeromonas TaxID=642 RepID=UPI0022E3BBE9